MRMIVNTNSTRVLRGFGRSKIVLLAIKYFNRQSVRRVQATREFHVSLSYAVFAKESGFLSSVEGRGLDVEGRGFKVDGRGFKVDGRGFEVEG